MNESPASRAPPLAPPASSAIAAIPPAAPKTSPESPPATVRQRFLIGLIGSLLVDCSRRYGAKADAWETPLCHKWNSCPGQAR